MTNSRRLFIVATGVTMLLLHSTRAVASQEGDAWLTLVRALSPERRTSRITDVQRLVKLRPVHLSRVLLYLAFNEPDPGIRGEAVFGLARLKDPSTVSELRLLRTKLGDLEQRITETDRLDAARIYTFAALYRTTGEAALLEAVMAQLEFTDEYRRSVAIKALSLIGSNQVREKLYAMIPTADYLDACIIGENLLDEQNTKEVRRRLREAIKKRPVVGPPIEGQEIREACIHELLMRLEQEDKPVIPR